MLHALKRVRPGRSAALVVGCHHAASQTAPSSGMLSRHCDNGGAALEALLHAHLMVQSTFIRNGVEAPRDGEDLDMHRDLLHPMSRTLRLGDALLMSAFTSDPLSTMIPVTAITHSERASAALCARSCRYLYTGTFNSIRAHQPVEEHCQHSRRAQLGSDDAFSTIRVHTLTVA
jgi:hypothetical protein